MLSITDHLHPVLGIKGVSLFFSWNQGYRIPDELRTRWPKSIVAADDILDAHAACWTAERILKGEAEQIPPTPEVDAKGLRMEM